MLEQIIIYFQENQNAFFGTVLDHIVLSIYSLFFAVIIAVPIGILCMKSEGSKKLVFNLFGILRIIPSLAILFLLIPVLGTGAKPAIVALVILAIPPILINTVTGLESVPSFMIETAKGCGMTPNQIWRKVQFPLSLPLVLTGIKTAAIEIIASATLAAKIGAGGLGEIIFTGLGLNRTELLLIGGISVAILSSLTGIVFVVIDKIILRYKN